MPRAEHVNNIEALSKTEKNTHTYNHKETVDCFGSHEKKEQVRYGGIHRIYGKQ